MRENKEGRRYFSKRFAGILTAGVLVLSETVGMLAVPMNTLAQEAGPVIM